MPGVMKARPYRHFAMESTGDADGMYLRQHCFPDTYEADEPLAGEYHDRLPHEQMMAACQKHLKTGDLGIKQSVMEKMSAEEVIAFFSDMLNTAVTHPGVIWTGFRLTGSVYVGRGKPIFYVELFAKRPDSKTKVYTGEKAPNVRGNYPRRTRTPKDIMAYGFGSIDT